MRTVYPSCCGVDVHKTFFVATIITTQGIDPRYQKRRFSTFNKQILAFNQWLQDKDFRDVCMESTKSSEKSRYQNVFTVCNVALDAVVSDMFGKSASFITDYITSSDTFDPPSS